MIDSAVFYAAALLTATGATAYLLTTARGRMLGTKPKRGTLLDRFEGAVRLRDVFRLAAAIEEDGIIFYRSLAERAKDPAVKSLCESLSKEEASHKALFEEQLGQWRQLPAHKLLYPALLQEARKKGIMADPPGPEATEDEMADFAIRQEMKTAEFYQAFEEAFPQAWKRTHMHALVLEEKKHWHDLQSAYPNLPARK